MFHLYLTWMCFTYEVFVGETHGLCRDNANENTRLFLHCLGRNLFLAKETSFYQLDERERRAFLANEFYIIVAFSFASLFEVCCCGREREIRWQTHTFVWNEMATCERFVGLALLD